MTSRGFESIKAQNAAVTTLRGAITHNRLAHAYLFEGPSGVGKTKAALALAAATLCPDALARDCDCSTCRRIYAGQHPDVRVFNPRDEGDRNIKIEFVREEILPFTRFAPFEARAAFVVFPDADVSFPGNHEESANALLKTLEEPKANVHFVLLSQQPDRLLATIRSRSQRVRFRALPPEVIDEVLAAHGVPAEARGPAISLSRGQADRALALCVEGRAQHLMELVLRIDDTLQTAAPGALLDLSTELSQNDDLQTLLDALALFYRDLGAIALGFDTKSLGFRHADATLGERARRSDPERSAARVQRIHQTMRNIERNANTELTINAMLFGLA
jgi:DNA polymerase-3 subunit delta'